MVFAVFIYRSPRYVLPRFESAGLSVQEKKFKICFQDCNVVAILDFWSEQIQLFLSTSRSDTPFLSGQSAFSFRSSKQIFKMAAILDIRAEQFKLFLTYKLWFICTGEEIRVVQSCLISSCPHFQHGSFTLLRWPVVRRLSPVRPPSTFSHFQNRKTNWNETWWGGKGGGGGNGATWRFRIAKIVPFGYPR